MDLIDDVSLGQFLLQQKNISHTEVPRVVIMTNKNRKSKDRLRLLTTAVEKNIYHIRIKNIKNRERDLKYLHQYTKHLYVD